MTTSAAKWVDACAALVLAAGLVQAPLAVAQGTARSLDIDTSIPAAGMGGANAGIAWGDPSIWGNPAAIGLVQGVRFEYGGTQLVPGLASDVRLTSSRTLLGAGGFGASLMGRPWHSIGGERLDYGRFELTDQSGNPLAAIDPREDVEAWGAGISLADAADALAARLGHPRRLSSWGDVAVGMQHKHVDDSIFGTGPAPGADAYDWGVLARVTPTSFAPPSVRRVLQVDVGFGQSVLNSNATGLDFGFFGVVPLSRLHRHGVAARAAILGPWAAPRAHGWRALAPWQSALIDLSATDDHEHISTSEAIEPPASTYDVTRTGFSATFLGLLTLRHGHVTDRIGGIDGATRGWGVSLPLGDVARIAYDKAHTPQASMSGLPDVFRHGWSGMLDPFALWRACHASAARS